MASLSLNASMDNEITFMTGVTNTGTVANQSFWTWNRDTPATYSSTTSYAAKWGAPVAGTSGGVVTYSFDPASNWTSKEEAAFASTYALWAAIANVSFQMVAPGSSADVVISRSSGTGNSDGGISSLYLGQIGTTQLGSAVTAAISDNTSLYGEGPLGSSFSNFGGYPWETILHEEGHTLGLGHTGAYNDTVDSSASQYTVYDGREWSIMSYINPFDTTQADYAQEPVKNGDWGSSPSTDGTYSYNVATTWMPLDILAIQRLYGMPVSTPLSGGQTFGFNCNIAGSIEPFFDFTQNTKPIITLWDEGTGNTLDLSGYSMTNIVDLHAGVFSSVGGLTHNVVIAFGVAIDTVIGGTGSDSLTANDDGDHIVGGLGNDELGAGLGKDFLDGGAGNDEFFGSRAQLAGDTILDFTFGDKIWIEDGSLSDNYVVSGNRLSWSTGSLTLDNGTLGAASVTADSAGGVDITFSGGSAASSSLPGGDTLVTSYGSYTIDQSVYSADGYELYSNFYDSTGRLTKQIGFASNGVETAEIDHFTDGSSLDIAWNSQGVLVSQTGFASQGWEVYANLYDGVTGRLVEQLAFASNGVKTAEIDDAADGSSFETTWSTSGTLSTLEQFGTNGQPVWKNTYNNSGSLAEQDGFASNGVKTIEIDHGSTTTLTTQWSSVGVIAQQVSAYSSGGYNFVKTYSSAGNLVEWDVYSVDGSYRQVETDYASDGSSTVKTYASPGTSILSQIGYSSTGVETYANLYDTSTGRLYEQDGFTNGIKTYEDDHAADGSSVVKTFNTSAALLSVTGYSTTAHESYANLYDASTGRLTVQQGFDSTGLKTTEIDHAADGSYTTSQFSAAGLTQETFYNSSNQMLETLTRNPSSGVYSLTGSVAGVTLTAISGTGTLAAGGGSTTFSVAQGFGAATVTNFVATGTGHDFVQVDSHLASDYTHLLADAQNVNGDVLFTFSSTDHLTLHNVQIAQLTSSDFLFV